MKDKTLADFLNLREIVETILRDYDIPETKRLEISERVYTMYTNSVKEVSKKLIEKAVERSAIARTFTKLNEGL
jgi:hypothetical protein